MCEVEMNILFVCEVDYVKYLVFELQELPELLSKMGHNVYVIDYPSMWKKEGSLDFISHQREERVVRVYPESSVKVIRPTFIKIPVLSRLTAFLSYWKLIGKVIKEKKIDAIVLYSVPTNGLQTVYFAQKYHIPIAFCSIDVLYQLVKSPILAKITYMLEKVVYRKVDVMLPRVKKLLQYDVKMGTKESKIRVMIPGVDTAEFKPDLGTDGLRERWGIGKGDKVVLFVGTLYSFSGLDLFITRFKDILQVAPNTKLLIVGSGEQHRILKELIACMGFGQNVIMTGVQPYNTIPKYINLADICICPFAINGATRDIFPIKVLQYLACGKPLVCTELMGVKEVIYGEEQGMVFVKNVDEMIEKVILLLKSDSERNRLGQNAVNYIRKSHTYDRMAKQLESELKTLVEAKSGK